MFQSPFPSTLAPIDLFAPLVLPQFPWQMVCQNAFSPGVTRYSLSVAVVTSPDSSFHNLHHILLVSRRSKAQVNRQGWSFSRIHSPKLSDCERKLLANNLVFWCSSSNSHSSSDPIAAFCSFSKVRCHKNSVVLHKLWYAITSKFDSKLTLRRRPVKTSLNNLASCHLASASFIFHAWWIAKYSVVP